MSHCRRMLRFSAEGSVSRHVRVVFQVVGLAALLLPVGVARSSPAGSWHVLGVASGGATFYGPSGLAVGPGGELYVADIGNSRVAEISRAGQLVHQWPVRVMQGLYRGGLPNPSVALARDRSGNLYLGGLRWDRVYRLSPGGRVDTFGPVFGNSVGVAAGPRGNIFVVDGVRDRLVKLDARGRILSIWSVPNPPPGTKDKRPEAVAVDAHGSVYVSTRTWIPQDPSQCEKYCWGGTTYHWVLKLSYTGRPLSWWNWDVCDAGVMSPYTCTYPGVLTVTPRGELFAANPEKNELYEFQEPTVKVDFHGISGLASDSQSHIYVSDVGTGRVAEITPTGKVLAQWGGGTALGQFHCPEAVAADANGNVFVDDAANARIVKLSSTGRAIVAWPLPSPPLGYYIYGCGPGSSMAVDHFGRVFLVDSSSHALRVYSGTGANVGTHQIANFYPVGVTVAPDGNLLLAGTDLAAGLRVTTMSPQGTILATGGIDLVPRGASLWVGDIAVDSNGSIYVSVRSESMIVKLSQDLHVVARWSGFADPAGLAIDAQHHLYVADTGLYHGPQSKRVQGIFELSASGKVLARWGAVGSNPGQFHEPQDIAVDGKGNLTVADTGNQRVQWMARGDSTVADHVLDIPPLRDGERPFKFLAATLPLDFVNTVA